MLLVYRNSSGSHALLDFIHTEHVILKRTQKMWCGQGSIFINYTVDFSSQK